MHTQTHTQSRRPIANYFIQSVHRLTLGNVLFSLIPDRQQNANFNSVLAWLFDLLAVFFLSCADGDGSNLTHFEKGGAEKKNSI